MATKKKASPKPKKKIAKEDQDVAANLGVDMTPDAPAPKLDPKKVRKLAKGIEDAGGAEAFKKQQLSIRAAKDAAESDRYQQTLAKMAGVPGVERVTAVELDPDRKSRRTRRRSTVESSSSGPIKEVTGINDLTQDEIDARYSDQGKFPVPKTPLPGLAEGLQEHMSGNPGMSYYTDIDELEKDQPTLTDEEREQRALRTHAKFEEVQKAAASASELRQKNAQALKEHNDKRRARGLGPVASIDQIMQPANFAAQRPLPKAEEPTYQQTIDEGTQERRAASLEKAKPIIAERTGKDIEDIGYAGDETYTDTETGHTDSVNGHALRMAQRDWDLSKSKGKEVNGISTTRKRTAIVNGKETLVDEARPRPEKIEDIYDTAHRTMAFNARHLGLTEEQMLNAPGQSRRGYEQKANTFMPLAKAEANSNRKINIANEIRPGVHKGWEDENGVKHNFVFQKDGKVSPLSLPSDFTRTAGPISAVAEAGHSIEDLMGAEQTPVDSEGNAAKSMSPKNNAGEYIEGVVTSHEGWTEHNDGYFRNIKHPIPEDQRISVAKKTAGRIVSMASQATEKPAKSGTRANSTLKEALPNPGPTGPAYDAMGAADFDPETTRNPRPPAISTRVLRSNRGISASFDDIKAALAAKKIKPEQASELNPKWDKENSKGVLITQSNEKPRSEMTMSEKRADTKARKAAMAETRAKAAKQPTRAQYQSKQFVDVNPVGKTESSAYLGAKADVTNDRNYITKEIGKVDPKTGKRMVREIGIHKGYEDLGLAAKKVEVEGSPVLRVMNDERGPVKEGEIIHRMVQTASAKQGMPERSDVKDAIRAGHISAEEGKELRNLDQFSQYRPQTAHGSIPQAKSMDDMKYSRLYEPTTAPAPRAGHKTPFTEQPAQLDDIKDAIRSKNISAAEGKALWDDNPASKPTTSRKKKTAAPKPVSSQMRSYYGKYEDIDTSALPSIRGRRGGAKEGAAREFGNWQNTPDKIIQHSLQPGDMVSHQTHGIGRVTRIVNPGEFIPGTQEISRTGRSKKNTGQKYTEHHAEINFGEGNVKHIPLTENISEVQRNAVAAATPENVPGFGGDIKTRGRLGLKADKRPIKAQPMLTKLERNED
jgi:hypothetical protein